MRLRNEQRAFMADLIEAIDSLLGTVNPSGTSKGASRGKTWDQKFEEDLEDAQARRRQDSGLMDMEKQ